jgi:hypothetical protein
MDHSSPQHQGKILSVVLLNQSNPNVEPAILHSHFVNQLNYNQLHPNRIHQFIISMGKLLCDKMGVGQTRRVKHEKYICWLLKNTNCLALAVITSQEYSHLLTIKLCHQLLDQVNTFVALGKEMPSLNESEWNRFVIKQFSKFQKPEKFDCEVDMLKKSLKGRKV